MSTQNGEGATAGDLPVTSATEVASTVTAATVMDTTTKVSKPANVAEKLIGFVEACKRITKEVLNAVASNALPIAVISIGGLFCILFFMAILQPDRIIAPLANTEYARGLITFLVALVTVAIALIMTFYSVLSTVDKHNEMRFNNAKEILTILIGVLGTVIGFYFGSATDKQTDLLNPSIVRLSNGQPHNGETVTMTNFVTGGEPPYVYAVTFAPNNVIGQGATGTSTDGVIMHSIPISTVIEAQTEVTLEMKVWDSAGQMATVASTRLLVSP